MDVRIVVLQRGWVAVGVYSLDGERAKLTKAHFVRRWGTSKGLGEIAAGGPTKNTVLDSAPDIEFHSLTEILNIRCNPEKWTAQFA